MSKLEPNKFFNDCEPLLNKIQKEESKIQYEKVKLEFSILHANEGRYLIQAKLFDKYETQQVLDYNSEIKRNDKKQRIIFERFFICNFYFQKEQKLQITLNKDQKEININTTMGEIIGSNNCTFNYNYLGDESLCIKAEKLGKEEDLLDVKFTFKHSSDPNYFKNKKLYYLITCGNSDIYESPQINDEGDFEPIHIPINILHPFYTVRFYNLQKKSLFYFKRTIDEIRTIKQTPKTIPLKNNLYLTFEDKSEITKNFTFIDYIKAGVKIALSIGIDFTGSNGHPKDFGSLHSIHGPNDYERAINACAKIVGKYDDDQLFPVFGFGAIINAPGHTEASMCFNLNFSKDPNIYGLENINKVYHDCIEMEKITFSGPTEFTPLIKEVISRINKDDLFEYHILMILTDGVIDDLQQTIDVIVEASFLPLSIIIVGIGNEDFKKMKILDGDDIPLESSKGVKRKRDLVQFVPFSDYQNKEEELAMEVLAEIPRQIVEFYQYKNLNPEKIENKMNNGKKNNSNEFNLNNEINYKKIQITNNINNNSININNNLQNEFNNVDILKKFDNNILNHINNNKKQNPIVQIKDYFSNLSTETNKNTIDKNFNISHIKNSIIKKNNNNSSKRSHSNSRLIPSYHYNDNMNNTIYNSKRNSIDSSIEKQINKPNPFYITININNNNSDKDRYKNVYDRNYNYTISSQHRKRNSLINSGNNIINSNNNSINKNIKNGIDNLNSNNGFKNYIDLKKISLSETIYNNK